MGAMEDIASALLRIAAAMERQAGAPMGHIAQPQPQYALNAPPQTPAYAPPPQSPPPGYNGQGITAEAITALIQPHVGNAQIKEALGATMREMGINALPDTQAHQFPELYQRFQGVIARFTGGGQAAPQPSPSII